MDPRFRFIYLFFGFGALALLFFYTVVTFINGGLTEVKPEAVFMFCLVSIFFLFMAYETYPDEVEV